MNWSENFTFDAVSLQRPTTCAALQEIVASSRLAKAVGTRHSFIRVADSPGGTLIDTSKLNLPFSIDHDAMTATVPGGWTYSRLVDELEAAGVALPNLASLPHISVAGGTATGTHGSGDTNQILAASISGLELVMADGSLRRFDRSSAELPALQVGLGAFGVIITVTLDIEPSFLVRQDNFRDTTWDATLENLDEIFASAYSVNMHAGFSEPRVRGFWCKERVDETSPPAAGELFGAARLTVDEPDRGRTTTLNVPGPWSRRLAHFLPGGSPSVGGDELQSEYYVERADGVDAINALRAMGDKIDPHLWGAEIRTIARDDIWLSPAYERDTLSIGFTWKKHIAEVHALLPEVEAALAPFDARPHWGKLFAMGRQELEVLFPKLDDAREVIDELDPTSKFTSPIVETLRH